MLRYARLNSVGVFCETTRNDPSRFGIELGDGLIEKSFDVSEAYARGNTKTACSYG